MKHTFFKILSLVIAVFVLAGLSLGAFAEKAALKTTQQFIDYLESKDYKYSLVGYSDGNEQVNVSFNLENLDFAKCAIFFDDDLDSVSFRIWNIITASAGKNYILSTVNSLNKDYKFGKFVFDESDSSIQVESDIYIDEDHCGKCVFDTMMILFTVIDDDEVAKKIQSME